MPKLKALQRYENGARNISVYPGDEIEVSDAQAAYLLADSPGSFVEPGKEKEAAQLAGQQQAEADAQAAARAASGEPTGGDPSPTGRTVPVDEEPLDAGVDVVKRADAAEQAEVTEDQETEEERARKAAAKALATPTKDKQVKSSERK